MIVLNMKEKLIRIEKKNWKEFFHKFLFKNL